MPDLGIKIKRKTDRRLGPAHGIRDRAGGVGPQQVDLGLGLAGLAGRNSENLTLLPNRLDRLGHSVGQFGVAGGAP